MASPGTLEAATALATLPEVETPGNDLRRLTVGTLNHEDAESTCQIMRCKIPQGSEHRICTSGICLLLESQRTFPVMSRVTTKHVLSSCMCN